MVGFDEIVLIGIVALLLFGPDKLPGYLRELGKMYAEVRKAQREIEKELSISTLTSVPANKSPSDTVVAIARKMGITVDGKTEEQLLSEIDSAVSAKVKSEPVVKAGDMARDDQPAVKGPADD
jgi:sec-independent protein translocase protein TatA